MTDSTDTDRLAREAGAPTADDSPVFEAPWQARAFALAVGLTREGQLDWSAFRTHLVDRVGAADPTGTTEDDYYTEWIEALEGLLVEQGIVDRETLAERAEAFASGQRDASEFVVGADHAHPHPHDHDHDH